MILMSNPRELNFRVDSDKKFSVINNLLLFLHNHHALPNSTKEQQDLLQYFPPFFSYGIG